MEYFLPQNFPIRIISDYQELLTESRIVLVAYVTNGAEKTKQSK